MVKLAVRQWSGIEQKIRHVRTPAGVTRYRKPVGSPIEGGSPSGDLPPRPGATRRGSGYQATAADWKRWEEGRDTSVPDRGPGAPWASGREAHTDLTIALRETRDRIADERGKLAKKRYQVADLTDMLARNSAKRTTSTGAAGDLLRLRKEVAALEQSIADGMAREQQQRRAVQAGDAELRPGTLPASDAANPLAVYGERLHVADRSPSTGEALHTLERYVAPELHRVIAGYYTERSGGGMYVGAKPVPDLDDLGSLRAQRPVGWGKDDTWAQVSGAHDSFRRVTAVGATEGGHGSVSLPLHEFGHALDVAVGELLSTGRPGNASDSDEFAAVYDTLGANPDINPYLSARGNFVGYRQEAWAEGFAAWSLNGGSDGFGAYSTGDAVTRGTQVLEALGVRTPAQGDLSETQYATAAETWYRYYADLVRQLSEETP